MMPRPRGNVFRIAEHRDKGVWLYDRTCRKRHFGASVGHDLALVTSAIENVSFWSGDVLSGIGMLNKASGCCRTNILPCSIYLPSHNTPKLLKAIHIDLLKCHECPLNRHQRIAAYFVRFKHGPQLQSVNYGDHNGGHQQPPVDNRVSWLRVVLHVFFLCFWIGAAGYCSRCYFRNIGNLLLSPLLVFLLLALCFQCVKSLLIVLNDCVIVTHKTLDTHSLLYYSNNMANVLNTDKQIAVIGALAEGSSIRSIERLTGIHRDTIMRLGVRVGKGCEMLMDSKMQDLDCHYLQFDELWGFVGKKERHVGVDDSPKVGDAWTFCAIDAETKLVPCFKVGRRDHVTANAFVQDVASRMRNRVQVSTDALRQYVEAIEQSFGADVDYGQIVKVYVHDSAQHPERKYSAPHFASALRRPISGDPKMDLVSTSYIERLNATTRLHMRRLTRLTLAFSKKLENFEAAVGLHFAYYNFVLRHNSLRCTPAMAAGIERNFWSVGDLVEAAS